MTKQAQRRRLLDSGIELLHERMTTAILDLTPEVALATARAHHDGPLPEIHEIWNTNLDFAADLTSFLVQGRVTELDRARFQRTLEWLASRPRKERQSALREVFRRVNCLELWEGPAARAANRRNLVATCVLALNIERLLGGPSLATALEDCLMQHRQGLVDRLCKPVAAAARQQPHPYYFVESDMELALDVFGVTSTALRQGVLGRGVVDPLCAAVQLPTGPDGALMEWDPIALGIEALRRAIFVDAPAGGAPAPPEIEIDPLVQQSSPQLEPVKEAVLNGYYDAAIAALRAVAEQSVTIEDLGQTVEDLAALEWEPEDFRAAMDARAVETAPANWSSQDLLDQTQQLWDHHSPAAAVRTICRHAGAAVLEYEARLRVFRDRLPILAAVAPDRTSRATFRLARAMEDALLASRAYQVAQLEIHLSALDLTPNPVFFGPDQHDLAHDLYIFLSASVLEGALLREQFDPMGTTFNLLDPGGGPKQEWTPTAFALWALADMFYGPLAEREPFGDEDEDEDEHPDVSHIPSERNNR